MFDWLKTWLVGASTDDGFGQSLADDLRFRRRFARLARLPLQWQAPTADARAEIEAHPILGRFGDDTIAVVEWEGRRLIVRERMWFGWPDPPEFIFFALQGDAIWAGADFDSWPRAWSRPSVDPPSQG
ncbi:hypothetical protein [Sphingomonas sp. M1-B02]|uniref:hypothetical protein n=1 Tax=Sphingomonas sp. M1-B02 TaxID=3114300 RepID=UPI002240AC55|nr:hypothetical protein [Sphingomonas sp. S6-11]UZK65609.1 hypothetical protein OKW87_13980 [Sphingomonas sp. S6-11]